MAVTDFNLVTDVIEAAALPIEGGAHDYDSLLKLIGEARFCLLGEATHGTYEFYRERAEVTKRLIKEKGSNVIGVFYLPQSERQSHYFDARLSRQFDVVIHFDETHALEPLERYPVWESGEPPETFPTGV